MTLLLGIDFETTGLDPQKDKVIEAGFVWWDTTFNVCYRMKSYLVAHPDVDALPDVNNLNDAIVSVFGKPPIHLARDLADILMGEGSVDYFVAHNAPFEKGFIEAMGIKGGLLPWIDTKEHIPGQQGKSLATLCYEHGVFNPMPHRALGDALAMMQVLAKYDFQEVERYATAKRVRVVLGYFPYDETKIPIAKGLGFGWDRELKQWFREVPDFLMDETIRVVEGSGVFRAHVATNEEVCV